MHYGINVATLGDYAHPGIVVNLAQTAESAGWEGLFIWDHLAFAWNVPSGDPWIILSAAAHATHLIKLGPLVTPLPRRRPQVVASAVASLDQLSDGRVIFGAGLGGVPAEFTAFGEDADLQGRAQKLDEGLAILDMLWSGKSTTFHGRFFDVDGVTLSPLPVQRPRIPIWIGGESDAALRRAARWDGWAVSADNESCEMVKSPRETAEQVAAIWAHRGGDTSCDVALSGVSLPGDQAMVNEYADAGVTWWLESMHGMRGSFEDLLQRIKAGPPA